MDSVADHGINHRIHGTHPQRKNKIPNTVYMGLSASDPAVLAGTMQTLATALPKVKITETKKIKLLMGRIETGLNSSTPILQESCLQCLNGLVSASSLPSISKRKIIRLLYPFLETPESPLFPLVLNTLSLLMKKSITAASTVSEDLSLQTFAKIIRSTNDPEIAILGVSCITDLIVFMNSIDVNTVRHLMEVLPILLRHDSAAAVKAAFTLLLRLFLKSVVYQRIAREFGILAILSELLKDERVNVVGACLIVWIPLMRSGIAYGEQNIDILQILELSRCDSKLIRIPALQCIDCFVRGKVELIHKLMECHLDNILFTIIKDATYDTKILILSIVDVILNHGDICSRTRFCCPEILFLVIDIMMSHNEEHVLLCFSVLNTIFSIGKASNNLQMQRLFGEHGGHDLIITYMDSHDDRVSAISHSLFNSYF